MTIADSGSVTYLERLAGLCGIEPRYRDIWGHEHEVSARTKQTLLAAMGFSVASERDAQELMEAQLRLTAQRTLPPVQVLREDGTQQPIEFTVPSGRDSSHLPMAINPGRRSDP
jgi:hypothetical protein